MKREIKFRVWNKDTKKWVTNLTMRVDNLSDDCKEWYELSQFTGLLDKNGQEIYEGDIVNIGFGGDRSVSYSEHKSIIVYWDSYRLQFCVKYRNEIVSLVGYHLPKYEIIGNVYETELTNK